MAGGVLFWIMAFGAAGAAQAAGVTRAVDAAWLARQIKATGAEVAAQKGPADALAATTELAGWNGPFAWRVIFYDCADPEAARGCADYEYVAGAVLSPGDAARADAWSRRQRFARAQVDDGVLILRFAVSVAGGVTEDFPAAQHARWLEAADDLARVLAVDPEAPAPSVTTAPPVAAAALEVALLPQGAPAPLATPPMPASPVGAYLSGSAPVLAPVARPAPPPVPAPEPAPETAPAP